MALVRKCRWDELYPECVDLARAHFEELRCSGEFAPKFEAFAAADKAGNMLLFGAWDDDRRLIGYISWTILQSLTIDAKIALQSAWYVKPEFRASAIGKDLMQKSLYELRALGVDYAYPHFFMTDERHDKSMDLFMRRLGAAPRQVLYELKLKAE